MGESATMIWTFLIVTLLITASGAASVINKSETTEDYLLASRSIPPWLSALSTVATNNSGFMFVGMIAASYSLGIETMWMLIGWVVGDAIAWWRFYPLLRARSGAAKTVTVTAILATGPEGPRRRLVIAASILTFVFLGIYAAAQLKAGSTALYALFGWSQWVGIAIGAGIVILYSFAGGIRADIWTDAAQSVVMVLSLCLILVAGAMEIGGPVALAATLRDLDPALLGLWPETLDFGSAMFVAGFVFAGMGSLGQPHLMTRIISMDHTRSIRIARLWYFLYMVPFWAACIAVGLYARAILPGLGETVVPGYANPAEMALPLLSMELLSDIFVGIALAGLFAATVSTADSQIILCSGVITQDMLPRWRESYVASKVATATVLSVGVAIAMFAPASVFDLVLVAWSALGATLGPVLVVRLFRLPLPTNAGLAMMAAGLASVTAWQYSGFDDDVFKMLPGALAAFAAYGVFLLRRRARVGNA